MRRSARRRRARRRSASCPALSRSLGSAERRPQRRSVTAGSAIRSPKAPAMPWQARAARRVADRAPSSGHRQTGHRPPQDRRPSLSRAASRGVRLVPTADTDVRGHDRVDCRRRGRGPLQILRSGRRTGRGFTGDRSHGGPAGGVRLRRSTALAAVTVTGEMRHRALRRTRRPIVDRTPSMPPGSSPLPARGERGEGMDRPGRRRRSPHHVV